MIGVFDSGYGGLTVMREIMAKLPDYDFIYLGDNARAPYGARSFEVIYHFTMEAVDYLFQMGCTVVVLACNTSSARALRRIQQRFLPEHYPDRRVLGVIRPSVEELAQIPVGDVSSAPRLGITGAVGVLGTLETIRSNSFGLELEKLAPKLQLFQQACPLWAPLVESGELEGDGPEWFVQRDLKCLLAHKPQPERILLACTHYPALCPLIEKHLGRDIPVLTQAPVIAERLSDWLTRHPEFDRRLSKKGSRRFLTTDDEVYFGEFGTRLLGTKVVGERVGLVCKTITSAPAPWPAESPAKAAGLRAEESLSRQTEALRTIRG